MLNKPTSEAGLLNKRLKLSSSFRCDQIYKYYLYDFGHTLFVLLKSDLDVQQTRLSLLNKRLMLSSSFRCDQIYKYDLYDFGHTLLFYLSQT